MILRLSILFLLIPQAALAQSPQVARSAVTRALPVLQRSAATFVAQRACVSCHHNALAIMTLRLAHQRGVDIDQNDRASICCTGPSSPTARRSSRSW